MLSIQNVLFIWYLHSLLIFLALDLIAPGCGFSSFSFYLYTPSALSGCINALHWLMGYWISDTLINVYFVILFFIKFMHTHKVLVPEHYSEWVKQLFTRTDLYILRKFDLCLSVSELDTMSQLCLY